MKRFIWVLIVLVGLSGSACDGPTAGEIVVDLATPSTTDGAILFKIEVPSSMELGEVTAACSACQAFVYMRSEIELYVVVTGPLSSGPVVRIAVSDAGARSIYAVTLLEVAGLDHRLRSNVGYELRISK